MEEKKTFKAPKASKSLVEKKRRARINRHLDELRELILAPNTSDGTNYSKMEKVNILQMTVQYFKDVRHQKQVLQSKETEGTATPGSQFMAGFSDCATEVSRFLLSSQDVDVNTKTRLLDHLACCLTNSRPASSLVTILPKTYQKEEEAKANVSTPLQILGSQSSFKRSYSSYGPHLPLLGNLPSHLDAGPLPFYQVIPNVLQGSQYECTPPMMIDGKTGAVLLPVFRPLPGILGPKVVPGTYGRYVT